ncbi:hypothetical protein NDU88_000328 [Pleurodeles waltl]|uniref:Uncharacterized protein n=1 Tax=Pleurodeles waltl TaxID=8319 RepID=A0AAV7LWJ1_PLEWA|nr:hypothetical protein NDU88_000328 [Pleurodeles waltl]
MGLTPTNMPSSSQLVPSAPRSRHASAACARPWLVGGSLSSRQASLTHTCSLFECLEEAVVALLGRIRGGMGRSAITGAGPAPGEMGARTGLTGGSPPCFQLQAQHRQSGRDGPCSGAGQHRQAGQGEACTRGPQHCAWPGTSAALAPRHGWVLCSTPAERHGEHRRGGEGEACAQGLQHCARARGNKGYEASRDYVLHPRCQGVG